MQDNEPVAVRGQRRSGQHVRAAGAALWQPGDDGTPRLAVVHRPRYDDWSLPKGKLDPGETAPVAAAREITEETGFDCVLSRYLTRIGYTLPASGNAGRDGTRTDKVVDYYAARALPGTFRSNEEVDALHWLTPAEARRRLDYVHDTRVIDAFESVPVNVATVLLVRHAKAGSRSEWTGDDTLRPLSEAGLRQQRALHHLLPLFGPERVHSAPRLRCEQTVSPVADDLGVGIGLEPLLSEEGYWPDPHAGMERLLKLVDGTGPALVCSQGGVIPDLVSRLAQSAGIHLDEVESKKASVWTLTFHTAETETNRSGSANSGDALPRLATADYLATPLAD